MSADVDSLTGPSDQFSTSPQPEIVLQTWNLNKTYRTGFWMNQKIESLKDCTLTVYQGETFGLLGPNGAGKTTLLKALLGIVQPTGGRGVLLGYPLGSRPVRQRVGYLPENPYFYSYLTGWEVLQFAGGLLQVPPHIQRKRIPQLLDLVGLSQQSAKNKQLRQYSKGMLQRIGMAQALMNDPEVVFLDEPMSGLDPLGRYQIREIIFSLKEQGKTIFFNSHVLADVEQICDRVTILARGEVICSGSLDELLGTSSVYHVSGQGGDPEVLQQWLQDLTFSGDHWSGYLQGDTQDFLSSLSLMEAKLEEMRQARPSLEEFFVEQIRQRGLATSQ